jgi:hypothetical protein
MLTLLIFPGGRRADAVLLSADGDRLRLAIAGRTDTTELTNVGGRWMNESGIPVEFGAIFALDGVGQFQKKTAARTMAAAGLPC